MEIVVRGQHFDVSERIDERCREKLGKLSHYLPALDDASIEVDITHQKAKQPDQRYSVHVTVSAHGIHLQTQEHAEQPETAIDRAAHVLSNQARKQKGLLYDRGRGPGVKDAAAELVETPAGIETPERIGRVKRFAVKPMTVDEALDEAEALGHEFFVFHHAELEQYAVLYRRRAGDFGLIVPELS